MTNTYFFVLGTNHTLSKIDIVNVLGKAGTDFEIVEASEEVMIISTGTEIEVEKLILELGSAAKIGKISKVYQEDDWSAESLRKEFSKEELGISVYNAGGKLRQTDKIFRETRNIGNIKEGGRILSTVTVDKKGLLRDGFELVICNGSKGIYVGKTLTIQDYESYSFRDYGRPARDAFSGMIPPKLAKMMINLAGKEKTDLFLDPFCGSGTILQELVLLGYKNMVGTDSSEKSVTDSTTNLNWLFEKYPIKKNDFAIKIVNADVRKLSSQVSFKTASAIVTEPYLGSPKASYFNEEGIRKEIKKLEELYLAAFDEFRKVLKDNGVVVIIFPVFRFNNKFFYLEILEQIKKLGFKKKDYLQENPKGAELLRLNLSSRDSVIFFRPGQTISREIFIFSL